MQKELSLEYNELSTPFEWSYSPITQMWYEDTEDIKPEFPIDTTWEADNVYVRLNDDCDEKSEEEFEQYINYLFGNISNGCDCFSLTWIFKAKNIVTSDIKYLEVCCCNDYLPLLEGFINNIKCGGYANLYIEAFSGVKLFAKVYNDKLHFVVQDYKKLKYDEANIPLFGVIYNVFADKEEFCLQIINNIRKYKLKCKKAIENYLTKNPSATFCGFDKNFIEWVMK